MAKKKVATKQAASQKAAPTKTNAARKKPAKPAKQAPMKAGPRADFGAPVEGFFAKQRPEFRIILETLDQLIRQAAPGVDASLKWGQPFYMLEGAMLCALGSHKAHVNLILVGPPDGFADPHDRLTGAGKASRQFRLTSIDELPRSDVKAWLRTAVQAAKTKQK